MDYIQYNKEAWEEAFEERSSDWGADIITRLNVEKFPFMDKNFIETMSDLEMEGKTIAQFCCNNGRELLSLMKFGFKSGIGFDIAENQISFANDIAKKTNTHCKFIATDILKIDVAHQDSFDVIVITIGALCWFRDLRPFFKMVAKCLKADGSVFIHEMHPVTNMLGAPGEDGYDETAPNRLVNSYFGKVWKENKGIHYITGKSYKSKTFTSFSHSLENILNAIIESGLSIRKIREFDYDIADGMFSALDHKGIPLSFILHASKS